MGTPVRFVRLRAFLFDTSHFLVIDRAAYIVNTSRGVDEGLKQAL